MLFSFILALSMPRIQPVCRPNGMFTAHFYFITSPKLIVISSFFSLFFSKLCFLVHTYGRMSFVCENIFYFSVLSIAQRDIIFLCECSCKRDLNFELFCRDDLVRQQSQKVKQNCTLNVCYCLDCIWYWSAVAVAFSKSLMSAWCLANAYASQSVEL